MLGAKGRGSEDAVLCDCLFACFVACIMGLVPFSGCTVKLKGAYGIMKHEFRLNPAVHCCRPILEASSSCVCCIPELVCLFVSHCLPRPLKRCVCVHVWQGLLQFQHKVRQVGLTYDMQVSVHDWLGLHMTCRHMYMPTMGTMSKTAGWTNPV